MAGTDDSSAGYYEDQPIPPRRGPLPARRPAERSPAARRRPYFLRRANPDWQLSGLPNGKAERFRRDAFAYAERTSDAVYEGDFRAYYTTYRDLTPEVREGYFGWRTRARQGVFGAAPLSFVFLYVYEILAQAGVPSPEAGYGILEELKKAYADETALQEYLTIWMRDYAVYYRLGEEYLSRCFSDVRRDDRLRALLHDPARYAPEEVFAAMTAAAPGELAHSAFRKAYPKESAEAMGRVYTALCAGPGRARTAEMFSGVQGSYPYRMFRNAVFAEASPPADCRCEIDPVRVFTCAGGVWRCTSLGGGREPLRSRTMAILIHETDRILREEFAFGHPVKPTPMQPELEQIIRGTVQAYRRELEEAKHPPVQVDRALLAGIRSDAAVTMTRLLDTGEAPEEAPAAAEVPPAPVPAEAVPPAGLTPDEYRFLRCLLLGEPWQEELAARRLLPSILADAVNEKLLATVGDTVIGSDGDSYEIIPDYLDDVRAILEA